jgi:hypothetical protein
MDEYRGRRHRASSPRAAASSAGAQLRRKGRSETALPLPGSGLDRYGQAEVRVTVFEVIVTPGTVGVLSESADVPVAVAE